MMENALWSLAGLIIGFVIGWWARCYRKGQVGMTIRKHNPFSKQRNAVRPTGDALYDPAAPIPTVIPSVTFDPVTGEPIIAREEVHKPSPIPRLVSIVIIVLACLSVAYLFWQKAQDADALKRANDRLSSQVHDNAALIKELKHQQGVIDANEQRLEDLILAVSTAKTPGQVNAAIQRFLHSSARAHRREQRYQQEHGGQAQPSSAPSGDTGGSAEPASSPAPRPQPSRSPSNRPSPTRSPSSRPTHSPRPSPSPTPLVCIVTPEGRVCTPALPHAIPIYYRF